MDALLRRRSMIANSGSSPTPPTPTPTAVDYIETDGTAYINTGVKGNAPMSVKLHDMVPVAPASGNSYVCGCRKDSGNTRLMFCIVSSGKTAGPGYLGSVYSTDIDVSASVDNQTPMTVQCKMKSGSQTFYVKQAGESSYKSKTHSTSGANTTNNDIYVFAVNWYGTASVAEEGTRIRVVQVYSDDSFGTLVFDGYACYYDGEYGLWDRVSDSFFGNAAGSGAFTGPSIQ